MRSMGGPPPHPKLATEYLSSGSSYDPKLRQDEDDSDLSKHALLVVSSILQISSPGAASVKSTASTEASSLVVQLQGPQKDRVGLWLTEGPRRLLQSQL